jgi:hypothetical protein
LRRRRRRRRREVEAKKGGMGKLAAIWPFPFPKFPSIIFLQFIRKFST